jgi:archaellum component FlaF (FlaF/FlaG flagellin family)
MGKQFTPLTTAFGLIIFTGVIALILAISSIFFGFGQGTFATGLQQTIDCDRANMRIENVDYDSNTKDLFLTVLNNGEVPLSQFRVDIQYSATVSSTNIPENSETNLQPQSRVTLTVRDLITDPEKLVLKTLDCSGLEFVCIYSKGVFTC